MTEHVIRRKRRDALRPQLTQRINRLRSQPLSPASTHRLLLDGLGHLVQLAPEFAARWLAAIEEVARMERPGRSIVDGLQGLGPEAVARRLEKFTALDPGPGKMKDAGRDWPRIITDILILTEPVTRLRARTPPATLSDWRRAAARWWSFPLMADSRPLPPYVPGNMMAAHSVLIAVSELVGVAHRMDPRDLRKHLKRRNGLH